MSEPIKKKKGRTMSPEMLEKLKIAREKGLAKIRENREKSKQNKQNPEPAPAPAEDTSEDTEIIEPPKVNKKKVFAPSAPVNIPVASGSKYSGVRKVKKTKVIYLTDDDSESEEEIVVKKPTKKQPKALQPALDTVGAFGKDDETQHEYIDPLLAKYNMY